MDKVEKAVIALDGQWPTKAIKSVSIGWNGPSNGDPDYVRYIDLNPDGSAEDVSWPITKPEFMEARRRLENKPTEWPEGADWVMQDLRGHWSFSSGEEPKPVAQTWHIDQRYIDSGLKGHVFGDWRKSLERRPDDKEENAVSNIDWSKAPEGAKYAAWRQGTDKPMLCWYRIVDGGWHYWYEEDSGPWRSCSDGGPAHKPLIPRPQPDNKEGDSVEWEPGVDLPPVGEWVSLTLEDEVVEVVVHGVGQKFCGRDQRGYIGIFDASLCEPIQSRRDKVIEAALNCCFGAVPGAKKEMSSYHIVKTAYGKAYDNGLLKLPGDEQ